MTELSVMQRGLGALFSGLTFAVDPLIRKLEKTMLLRAVADKNLDEAESIARRLMGDYTTGTPEH